MSRINSVKKLSYLLYLPQAYAHNKQSYPLILYLHGGSLRGDSLDLVRRFGLPQRLEHDPNFPFVVVSPQCPVGEIWTDSEQLIAVLDEVARSHRIDTKRVYLTGHSMGGRGTWYLAYKYPERFAAIAPISAPATIEAWAPALKQVPVWAFHGARDEQAPVTESRRLVSLLRQLGNAATYTEYAERDHFILDVYNNPLLYQWFLRHSK